MKKVLLLSAVALLALSGCKKYRNKEVYANVPIYMSNADYESSFEFTTDVQMVQSGNIYVYNNWIFVSDEDRGIHIVDNSDPYNPYVVGFMNIIGNTQMAVNGSYLYANSVTDLLVIDISNIYDPQLINREEDVFQYSTPVIADDEYPVANVYQDSGIVVGWEIKKTKDVSGWGTKYFVKDCASCEEEEADAKMAMRTGLAGSMSKFSLVDNYLYVIDGNELITFDVSSSTNPDFKSRQNTWRDPETIFPNGNHLFVGTTTGMIIYDRDKSPEKPDEVSEIDHTESCDPVVVQGDYAYVTLRSGNDCGQTEDELQVIDISNIKNPFVRKRYDMTNPHGLGVEGDLLFICDGDDGLKVYDNSVPKDVGKNELYHFSEIQSRDIILNGGILVMVSDEGVYQYDYSNPSNINFVSLLVF